MLAVAQNGRLLLPLRLAPLPWTPKRHQCGRRCQTDSHPAGQLQTTLQHAQSIGDKYRRRNNNNINVGCAANPATISSANARLPFIFQFAMTRRFVIRFPPCLARGSGAQWYTLNRLFSKNSSNGFAAYGPILFDDRQRAYRFGAMSRGCFTAALTVNNATRAKMHKAGPAVNVPVRS